MKDEITNPSPVEAFRMAMRQIAATVTIISTKDGVGDWVGITATAVTSVSFDPPSMLVCVNRASPANKAIRESRAFCVNLLVKGHHTMAGTFGSTDQRANRFIPDQWRTGMSDIPYLIEARANLFCEVADAHEFGTHTIVIGVVKEARITDSGSPLIYLDGKYLP
jgi:flavin reductase (DIM6/NTAB) family NADH-FMN oxidoreductase RutF